MITHDFIVGVVVGFALGLLIGSYITYRGSGSGHR